MPVSILPGIDHLVVHRSLVPAFEHLLGGLGQPHRRWVGPLPYLLKMIMLSPFVKQKLVVWVAKQKKDDLLTLKDLLEAGKVTPVIDRTYPLSEVPEAIRYLEKGHARGKVVITV